MEGNEHEPFAPGLDAGYKAVGVHLLDALGNRQHLVGVQLDVHDTLHQTAQAVGIQVKGCVGGAAKGGKAHLPNALTHLNVVHHMPVHHLSGLHQGVHGGLHIALGQNAPFGHDLQVVNLPEVQLGQGLQHLVLAGQHLGQHKVGGVHQVLVKLVLFHIGAVHHLKAAVPGQPVGRPGQTDEIGVQQLTGVNGKAVHRPHQIGLEPGQVLLDAGDHVAQILHHVVLAQAVGGGYKIAGLGYKRHPVGLLQGNHRVQTVHALLIGLFNTHFGTPFQVRPEICRASTAKIGKVMMESRVDRVTMRAAVVSSLWNIWANMEVMPAVGQAESTTQAQ